MYNITPHWSIDGKAVITGFNMDYINTELGGIIPSDLRFPNTSETGEPIVLINDDDYMYGDGEGFSGKAYNSVRVPDNATDVVDAFQDLIVTGDTYVYIPDSIEDINSAFILGKEYSGVGRIVFFANKLEWDNFEYGLSPNNNTVLRGKPISSSDYAVLPLEEFDNYIK